jgi:RNA polymerase subunit RPABC4/transcription elongation factor Spt4
MEITGTVYCSLCGRARAVHIQPWKHPTNARGEPRTWKLLRCNNCTMLYPEERAGCPHCHKPDHVCSATVQRSSRISSPPSIQLAIVPPEDRATCAPDSSASTERRHADVRGPTSSSPPRRVDGAYHLTGKAVPQYVPPPVIPAAHVRDAPSGDHPTMVTCSTCGTPYPSSAGACPNCHAPLERTAGTHSSHRGRKPTLL